MTGYSTLDEYLEDVGMQDASPFVRKVLQRQFEPCHPTPNLSTLPAKKIGWTSLEEFLEDIGMQEASPGVRKALGTMLDFKSFEQYNEESRNLRKEIEEISHCREELERSKEMINHTSATLVTLEKEFDARQKELDNTMAFQREMKAGINALSADRHKCERMIRKLYSRHDHAEL